MSVEGTETQIDFYDELGLDRDDSLKVLREKLEEMRKGWASRASRAGARGDDARRRLVLISRADAAFASDESKETYDLELLRAKRNQTEDPNPEVDWLSRAWNYYFMGDDGAATVAVRRAREALPNQAMPYVVSAWVKLRQSEYKDAKRDADEAFVLDELGEDTVDVHLVRGVTFHAVDAYENAIKSFRRALVKAGEQEQVEIHARIAWSLLELRNYQEVIDEMKQGLEREGDLPFVYARSLTRSAGLAVSALYDGSDNPERALAECKKFSREITESSIQQNWKDEILTFVDLQIKRNEELVKIIELRRVTDATGDRPKVPIAAIIVMIVFFALTGAWSMFAFLGLIAMAVSGFMIYRLYSWTSQRSAYSQAQSEIESHERRADELKSKSEKWFAKDSGLVG
ncbi:hypothetical protein [Glutamicibacter ardleyensis]|uniref:hypothetical protein n=1 Tax=Glutamicibacter ardleyensis TaxID=225894 RepID=UPI003FD04813